MINPLVQRAALLMQHGRWDLADRELRQALSDDQDDAEAHRLLSACLVARERFDDAETEARLAIQLAPADADAHRTLAVILMSRRRFAEARLAVDESIRLDPQAADSFALLSQLCQQKEDWRAMLDAANQGLQIEPEDVDCNNLRAVALTKLGRRQEAGQTIAAALARAPDNSLTHANEGWRLLEDRQRGEAMEHFQEALRLDPENEWARRGIVEGLKSKNFVYRWLLGYFLYMARLSSRTGWMLLIGAYVLFRIGHSLASMYPEAAPFIDPLLYAYMAFALLTWLGSPVFNLLLFLDKRGRCALSTDQKRGAIVVGSILLLAGASFLLALAVESVSRLNMAALGIQSVLLALTAIPASTIWVCSAGWPRRVMAGVTVALVFVGLGPILCLLLVAAGACDARAAIGLAAASINLFIIGLVGSQFLTMALANVEPRR